MAKPPIKTDANQEPVSLPSLSRSSHDVHHNVLAIGDALFEIRRIRSFYLDDYISSDGAFSTVLAMYIDTARGLTTSIERVVAAADVSLGAAIYILGILVDTGQVHQVGPVGQEHYSLSAGTEQAMYRYLSDCVDRVRQAGRLVN